MPEKPLNAKAYGSIAHLPGSRLGPGDHHCHVGQARIATAKTRDKHDQVFVTEKLDGTNVAVAKIDGILVPLIRSGYRAKDSHYRQHHLFDAWVWERQDAFDEVLGEGERIVGEWLAMAHSTRYDLTGRSPFVAFDIMTGKDRLPYAHFLQRLDLDEERVIGRPKLLATGPTHPDDAMRTLGEFGFYGALDPVEGAVWRVERQGKVDFLAKYVRPDKVDGSYFGKGPNGDDVWNWQPSGRRTLVGQTA